MKTLTKEQSMTGGELQEAIRKTELRLLQAVEDVASPGGLDEAGLRDGVYAEMTRLERLYRERTRRLEGE